MSSAEQTTAERRNFVREVVIILLGLAVVASFSLFLILHSLYITNSVAEYALGLYILLCSVTFHVTEFCTALACGRIDVHPGAFMLFHSPEYMIAMAASFLEFFIEFYLVPESWKIPLSSPSSSLLRLTSFTQVSFAAALVALFYGIRVIGMLHCGSNFSLMIEEEKRNDHVLVKTGIYKYLRHPAYFGWFWRTAVSQWVLMNPICFVGFVGVTWYFFSRRIPFEESLLCSEEFFGEEYEKYAKTTWIGIPFIHGYRRPTTTQESEAQHETHKKYD